MCAFKKSFYTITEQHAGKTFLLNTKTRAVAELVPHEEDEVLSFLSNPLDIGFKYFSVLKDNGFIVDSSSDETAELEYAYNVQFFNSKNYYISILPTLKCNFNCPYCFENEHSSNMAVDKLNLLFDVLNKEVKKMETLHISLFGGEPLLKWKKIYNYLLELKTEALKVGVPFSVSITTNGYLLNKIDCNEFIKSGVTKLHVTLDCDRDSHNNLRKTKSNLPTFDVIIYNLRCLAAEIKRKNYAMEITLRANLLNNTYSDLNKYLSEFSECDKQDFLFYFKPIFNTDCFSVSNSNAKNYKEISLYAKQQGFNIISPFDHYGYGYCSGDGGKNTIMITPDLNIWKCFNDKSCETANIGKITKDGFIWDEKKLMQWYSKSPFKSGKCKNCKKLPLCFGGCPLHFINSMERHCIDSDTMNLTRDLLLDS